jgi:nicotinamidase-related amidase
MATIIEEWREISAPPAPPVGPVTIAPAKTALFLMDFLASVCTEANRPRAAAAVARLAPFLQQARARGLTIVHTSTRHGRQDGSDLAEAIRPVPGERVYRAPFDKFHGNDLESYLRGRGVETVIATGTSANGCLLFTTAGAVLRGFRVVVPVDAMPAATPYQEQFVAWEIGNGPGLRDKAVLTRLDAIGFAGT